jgi:hypothetical protein
MKKNILVENMKRFATKNLAEQEEPYQTLGQKGERYIISNPTKN